MASARSVQGTRTGAREDVRARDARRPCRARLRGPPGGWNRPDAVAWCDAGV